MLDKFQILFEGTVSSKRWLFSLNIFQLLFFNYLAFQSFRCSINEISYHDDIFQGRRITALVTLKRLHNKICLGSTTSKTIFMVEQGAITLPDKPNIISD